MYVSRFGFFTFNTTDKIKGYITIMSNNILPYPIAVGENKTCWFNDSFKFINNDSIEESTLLKTTDRSLDPYVSHKSKC